MAALSTIHDVTGTCKGNLLMSHEISMTAVYTLQVRIKVWKGSSTVKQRHKPGFWVTKFCIKSTLTN
jgi:hypothetical protein